MRHVGVKTAGDWPSISEWLITINIAITGAGEKKNYYKKYEQLKGNHSESNLPNTIRRGTGRSNEVKDQTSTRGVGITHTQEKIKKESINGG